MEGTMNMGMMIPAVGTTEGLATGATAPTVATPAVKTGLGAGAVTGIALGSAVGAGVGMFFLGKHVGAKKERAKWVEALEGEDESEDDEFEYYEDADDDQDLKEVQDDGSPKPEVKETKKSGKKKRK